MYRKLGDWLESQGLVTPIQLEQALEVARQRRLRIGEALVATGACTDLAIAEALAKQFDLPLVDPATISIQRGVTKRLAGGWARSRTVLLVRVTSTEAHIVIADPLDLETTDQLREALGRPLVLSLAPFKALRERIDSVYRFPTRDTAKTPSPKRPMKLDPMADRIGLLRGLEGDHAA